MNKVHRDGRALLKLSNRTNHSSVKEPSPRKVPSSRPAPAEGIQRQDTDYDVKPEIPVPNPTHQKPNPEKARQQAQMTIPDDGVRAQATQMGESESGHDRDAQIARTRMLRSLCG